MSTSAPYRPLPSWLLLAAARGREELARLAPSGRPVVGEWDFVSPDGTVIFTTAELEALEMWCPSIDNMRRMVRAACRGWLQRVPPRQRKRALIEWLIEREAKEWVEIDRSLDRESAAKQGKNETRGGLTIRDSPVQLGPPARSNLKPSFAKPDDATAWFTRSELRQHHPGAFAPMSGSTTEEEKAERRRAKNREYLRKHRAKRTVEQIDRQREHVRRHRAKVAAAKLKAATQ
jgi:hypothetical protein